MSDTLIGIIGSAIFIGIPLLVLVLVVKLIESDKKQSREKAQRKAFRRSKHAH